MKLICFLLISCAAFTACHQVEPVPAGPWDDTVSDSTVIMEIPVRKDGYRIGKRDLLYEFRYYDAKGLGLDSLESGYNSFQLRAWLGHSMAIIKNVVVIYNTKRRWHATIITYRNPTQDEYKAAKINGPYRKILERREAIPSSGWAGFIKKMLELQVINLPNADDLTGYNGCGADGISYDFEVATRSKYRFFYYCNPDINTAKYWQAKNVLAFAALLEKEFAFTYDK